MNHIDLSTVLRQTVACDLYSNLVTRPTGAAIRNEIERLIADARSGALTVIDFSHVSMIDFSCADEVIAKLVLRYCAENAPRDAYFLFRGVTEDHWDAIEAVLERHGLALAVEREDGIHVVGVLPDAERRAWEIVYQLGPAGTDAIAAALGSEAGAARAVLEALTRRRLIMNLGGRYLAVGSGRATGGSGGGRQH